MNEVDELNKKMREQCVSDPVSLLEYFAAHEPTSPPQAFMLKQFPPNPIKAKNGAPMPTSDPTAEELAAALAKWRFMVAEEMVKESHKRSA